MINGLLKKINNLETKSLSSIDINNIMFQYESKYQDFKFLGAVPIDFEEFKIYGIQDLDFNQLLKEGKYRIGIVINTDESHKPGSYWISLFFNFDNGKIYFYDCKGIDPNIIIKNFINKIEKFFKDNFKKTSINYYYTPINQYDEIVHCNF